MRRGESPLLAISVACHQQHWCKPFASTMMAGAGAFEVCFVLERWHEKMINVRKDPEAACIYLLKDSLSPYSLP